MSEQYRAECMSGYTDEVSPWLDTKNEAWNWIDKIQCRLTGDNKPCKSCQAEWDVFSDEEIKQMNTEIDQYDSYSSDLMANGDENETI